MTTWYLADILELEGIEVIDIDDDHIYLDGAKVLSIGDPNGSLYTIMVEDRYTGFIQSVDSLTGLYNIIKNQSSEEL